jgi:hypothetical protein
VEYLRIGFAVNKKGKTVSGEAGSMEGCNNTAAYVQLPKEKLRLSDTDITHLFNRH